jgi:putative transposase
LICGIDGGSEEGGLQTRPYNRRSFYMDVTANRRKDLRLRHYDYTQAGAYFITLCVCHRACLLGVVRDDSVHLSASGDMVAEVWADLPNYYANLALDAFVIMPNHIHGIIFLSNAGAGFKPAQTGTNHALPEIVRGFKTFSAKRINVLRQMSGTPVWQRNYFEHVIRNETELLQVRQYIENNPAQWALDAENPVTKHE